jgi:YjzC-like protein
MSKNYKPGERAPRSGVYVITGPRGGRTSEERAVTRGQPLPPTNRSGQRYELVKPLNEGRSKAKTQDSISRTRERFSDALNRLGKR